MHYKSSGTESGNKPRIALAGIVLVVVAIVVVIGIAVSKKLDWPLVDGDGRYVFQEKVIEEIDARSSMDVPTTAIVASSLSNRGFGEFALTSGYDMEGRPVEDEQLDPTSNDKHPLYNAMYLSSEGRPWVIYVCNGSYMANPLFMYDLAKVPYILVEEDFVTSYSSIENKFIRTVPDESEVIIKKVGRIDASTLDGLDEMKVEAL